MNVAPRVGAWIETSYQWRITDTWPSHPVWVRGLKPDAVTEDNLSEAQSHPVWVRGLKPSTYTRPRNKPWSHPVWVRGLKLRNDENGVEIDSRTPCGCVD